MWLLFMEIKAYLWFIPYSEGLRWTNLIGAFTQREGEGHLILDGEHSIKPLQLRCLQWVLLPFFLILVVFHLAKWDVQLTSPLMALDHGVMGSSPNFDMQAFYYIPSTSTAQKLCPDHILIYRLCITSGVLRLCIKTKQQQWGWNWKKINIKIKGHICPVIMVQSVCPSDLS